MQQEDDQARALLAQALRSRSDDGRRIGFESCCKYAHFHAAGIGEQSRADAGSGGESGVEQRDAVRGVEEELWAEREIALSDRARGGFQERIALRQDTRLHLFLSPHLLRRRRGVFEEQVAGIDEEQIRLFFP